MPYKNMRFKLYTYLIVKGRESAMLTRHDTWLSNCVWSEARRRARYLAARLLVNAWQVLKYIIV